MGTSATIPEQKRPKKMQVMQMIISPTPFLVWRLCGSPSTRNSLHFYNLFVNLDGCPVYDFSPVAISLIFHALGFGVCRFFWALIFSPTIIICFVFI